MSYYDDELSGNVVLPSRNAEKGHIERKANYSESAADLAEKTAGPVEKTSEKTVGLVEKTVGLAEKTSGTEKEVNLCRRLPVEARGLVDAPTVQTPLLRQAPFLLRRLE